MKGENVNLVTYFSNYLVTFKCGTAAHLFLWDHHHSKSSNLIMRAKKKKKNWYKSALIK